MNKGIQETKQEQCIDWQHHKQMKSNNLLRKRIWNKTQKTNKIESQGMNCPHKEYICS